MRALEFIMDHVTFKLPYDFSYQMKTPKVCQLILCHNNILIIGEWQSLQIKQLGQAKNSIVSNIKM